MARKEKGRTGQGVDILEVARGAVLENNGTTVVAAAEGELKGLALDNVELGVGEAGLGQGAGGKGSGSGSDGVLHF